MEMFCIWSQALHVKFISNRKCDANTVYNFFFLSLMAPLLHRMGPHPQGCVMDLRVCSLHLEENHLEASVKQSLEAEVRLTFPCVWELSLLQCTVRAVIEWISQWIIGNESCLFNFFLNSPPAEKEINLAEVVCFAFFPFSWVSAFPDYHDRA